MNFFLIFRNKLFKLSDLKCKELYLSKLVVKKYNLSSNIGSVILKYTFQVVKVQFI